MPSRSDSNTLDPTPRSTHAVRQQRTAVVRYPIGIHELYLIEVLPNGPTQRQITFVSVPLLISLTAILLLGCSLAFLLHRMIAHPISALQSRIEKISGGDFSADPDIEWDNELGDIGRGINSMSAGVTALMEHRLEDEKAEAGP
mgnify:CR=1 FL=1